MSSTSTITYESLAAMIMGYRQTALIYVAARLRVPDALKAGPLSAEEIAQRVSAQIDPLHRVLRGLANLDLVRELEDGRFSLLPAGEYLCSDSASGLRGLAVYMGGLSARAYTGLYDSVRDGGVPFERAFGQTFYDYLKGEPEIADAYNKMLSFGGAAAMLLVSSYDFTGIHTLVDVGGADGTLLCAILQAYPALRGVVFDKPEFVHAAEPQIRGAGLSERCAVAPGDFFEAVPSGGDAYLLARVITNWSEEQALQILGNCRRAMQPGAKLLMVEQVLPERVEKGHLAIEGDINVYAHLGGHVRTEAEFRGLLERAGFLFTRSIPIAPVLRRGFHVMESTRA
jgi:hypothetical protein